MYIDMNRCIYTSAEFARALIHTHTTCCCTTMLCHGRDSSEHAVDLDFAWKALARCADAKIANRSMSLPDKMEQFFTQDIFPVAKST